MVEGEALQELKGLPKGSVEATITSPPYFRQKDYGIEGQIGWESSVQAYTASLSKILKQLWRVTSDRGSCFVVVGDTYWKKSLQLVPQRLAIAAHQCGWTVRNDLIWSKLDAPPDNATDRWRFTHEHILFLTKRATGYTFNVDAIRIPYSPETMRRWGNGQSYGGNKAKDEAGPKGQRFKRGKSFRLHPGGTIARDVLEYATARSSLDHFATYPVGLIERLVLATTSAGDLILDPFAGTATTGIAAMRHQRRFLGIELNPKYVSMARAGLSALTEADTAL
jgi:DNA modification methylase